jgi:hypothetical protein
LSRAKKAAGAAFASAIMLSVMASPALAFHHTSIPASECAGANAGSPSNDNGQAKENLKLQERGGEAVGLPLPPVGTPGAGQGQGDEHCLNGR